MTLRPGFGPSLARPGSRSMTAVSRVRQRFDIDLDDRTGPTDQRQTDACPALAAIDLTTLRATERTHQVRPLEPSKPIHHFDREPQPIGAIAENHLVFRGQFDVCRPIVRIAGSPMCIDRRVVHRIGDQPMDHFGQAVGDAPRDVEVFVAQLHQPRFGGIATTDVGDAGRKRLRAPEQKTLDRQKRLAAQKCRDVEQLRFEVRAS